ncbi:MAG TPA: ABC transporter permease [Cyclobacteriaceae bacterium]|nr:ABC transporter permease [Cyclobacteriaceae bacterium]
MFRNYIKILFRNFIRNKTFSLINILGLSAGLTCSLLIGLYVADEFAFDRHHENGNRIYRLLTDATFDGQTRRWTGVANKVSTTAQKEIPEVEKSARMYPHEFGKLAFVSNDTVRSSETSMMWADKEIFEILSFPFLKGDSKTALQRPNSITLSENSAKKYFGTTDVLGKTLKIDSRYELEITGVYENPPPTSRFQHPLIASLNSHWFGNEKNQSWSNASFETYLLLHNNANPEDVELKLAQMIDRNVDKADQYYTLKLQPLYDAYLFSGEVEDHANPEAKRGDILQVKILIGLGIIVILIASVNYMNLSTAQSQRRYKEIGISKTLGASSLQLARQFYIETSVFVLLSISLSIILASLALPIFNSITGKLITVSFLSSGLFWTLLLITWIALSLLSGIYPALYLSSFSPKRVLKISSPSGGGNVSLRRGLVIGQFSISIVLIICTTVLYQQLNFIRNKQLGYKPEQVVAILTSGAQNGEQVNAVRSEFERIPGVVKTVRSQAYPGAGGSGRTLPPLDGNGEGKYITTVRTTSEILDILDIHLLAGKTLPENKSSDDTTTQVILNKSAVDFLGISPEEAIKRKIKIAGFQGLVEVTGVTEDFHYASMREQIAPYCFHNARTEGYSFMLVKLDTKDLNATLAQMEHTYRKIVPSAFEFLFLDERLAALYRQDQQLAKVIFIFASLAIFIACLGLYALAAYSTEQRTKEIGIRKVLGASVIQLTNMLSKDFIKLVLIAFIFAAPVGYLLMKQWLETFVYRIDINPLILLFAGSISLIIAWFTVGIESMKAAFTNPVDSLRNE